MMSENSLTLSAKTAAEKLNLTVTPPSHDKYPWLYYREDEEIKAILTEVVQRWLEVRKNLCPRIKILMRFIGRQ
jgi:hypothetical protein